MLGGLEARLTKVGLEHQPNEAFERCRRSPAEDALGLRRVAAQLVDLGGAEVARIDPDMALPVKPDQAEGRMSQLANGMHLAGSDDVVVGIGLL